MAHQIENNKAAASAADVANQVNELILFQVVHHADADGYFCFRKGVAHGVETKDRNFRIGIFGWLQINAKEFRVDLQPDLAEQFSMTAANVQHAAHCLPILFECTDNRRMIA